jgi:hypothetical protein
MRITIIGQTRPIAFDGNHVSHVAAGITLDVHESLGLPLVRDGWAVEAPVETVVEPKADDNVDEQPTPDEQPADTPDETKVIEPKGKKGKKGGE